MSKFFEDVRIGEQTFLGHHTFESVEITNFAKRFDPQVFHTDAEAAKDSFYGEQIASGWHTSSVCMRLWVNCMQTEGANAPPAPGERQPRLGPSPGIRELRWLLPVRAGDTVAFSIRVIDKTQLRSRPQWGLVSHRFAGKNQTERDVISFIGQTFFERRGGGRN